MSSSISHASEGGFSDSFEHYVAIYLCKCITQQRRNLVILIIAIAVLGIIFISNLRASNPTVISGLDKERENDISLLTIPPMIFGIAEQSDSGTAASEELQTSTAVNEDSQPNSDSSGLDLGLDSDSEIGLDVESDRESTEVDINLGKGGVFTTPLGYSTDDETTEDPSMDEEPTWEASYNTTVYYQERTKTSCYRPEDPVYYFYKRVEENEFKEKDCQKRLPKVIIAGMRKCGTGTIMRFLNMHPNVAVTNYEIHYFDNNYDRRGDIEWYRDQMQFSSSLQVPMEKTPTYFFRPYDAPQQIRKVLSKDVKIIVILCDPISRAVSDYLEFVRKIRSTALNNIYSRKYLAPTFEKSVINDKNEIQVYNEIVDVGIYVKYVQRWMEYFPLKQQLYVDGEKFKVDPTAELRRAERFLGLRPFFRREHFYLDKEKGFYCLNYPEPSCMGKAKGRKHPEVDPKVLKALCQYYTPYDKALESTLNQKFMWVGKC